MESAARFELAYQWVATTCLTRLGYADIWRGEWDLNPRNAERPNALAERPLKPNLSISPLVGEVGLAPTVFLRHGFTVRCLRYSAHSPMWRLH